MSVLCAAAAIARSATFGFREQVRQANAGARRDEDGDGEPVARFVPARKDLVEWNQCTHSDRVRRDEARDCRCLEEPLVARRTGSGNRASCSSVARAYRFCFGENGGCEAPR